MKSRMKLRVRINKQTSRLVLEGAEPTITELSVRVRDILLPSYGLRSDVQFSLSLNGTEALVDTGQTLCSCGVVSGDMISVILTHNSSPTSQEEQKPPVTICSAGVPKACSATAREEAGPSCIGVMETGMEGSAVTSPRDCGMMEEMEPEECDREPALPPPPLLCCEAEGGSIPDALERLLHSSSSRKPAECVMLAAHLLLLEMGFIPQGGHVTSGEMPIGWRAEGGMFRLQYTHPLLENSLVLVIAVPMGCSLVINDGEDNGEFPEAGAEARPLSEDSAAGVTYRDLRKLSRRFKDQLVYPLMASARQALGLPALFGLVVLPPELMLRVLRLLDVKSLISLSAVCRDLNSITLDPSLWRHLLHRDFTVSSTPENQQRDVDWKELYKKKYKQRKITERRRRSWCCTPYIPPIQPMSPYPPDLVPPPPLYPPGIIGGDYDQMPLILPRPRFNPIGPLPALVKITQTLNI
ncbi:hypothetical protein DNTS_025198 [Danionella cerebrum]|uniref:F-box domain-containing protein n=1 Tax=Danionella cerebrum TaxID=2873325 RepID=A0A553QIF9_9TELE|nr:hypothetical protein DNTS_025198 [Danionella translucida]